MTKWQATEQTAALLQEHKAFYTNEANLYYYPSERSEGLLITEAQNHIARILDGTKRLDQSVLAAQHASYVYLSYADYALLALEDAELAFENFVRSSRYALLAVGFAEKSRECFGMPVFVMQEHLTRYLAQTMLCGWWDDVKSTVQAIRNALQQEQMECFIAIRDNRMDVGLWFLLELHNRKEGVTTDTGATKAPEVAYPYDKVLDAWDTGKTSEVDLLTGLLCEVRATPAEGYEAFQQVTTRLFPYEVLAWLALRKKAGLQNPAEFSHPLMNIPLAQMFLNLETPLSEPEELPYAEELIAKLVENCPKLAGEPEPEVEPKASAEPKTAPKTGRYRATLPEDHPQYEALGSDPQAYRTYKEGEHFSNAGLEEYDAEKIEWELVE